MIREGLKITEAIQVCFSLSDEKTKNRELQALSDARNELKTDVLTVLTDDEEGMLDIEEGTVRVIPLWKWLALR